MFSSLRKMFGGKTETTPANQVQEVQSEGLPPTSVNLEIQGRLNALAKEISEKLRAARIGQRHEIHAITIEVLSLIDRGDEFAKDNPGFRIENLEEARSIALRIFNASVPLHEKQDETSILVCIVDTETTGVGDQDEPISVATVLVEVSNKYGDALREVDSYAGFREPSIEIGQRAHEVHGMTIDDVRGQQFDMARLHKIIDSADVLVAHNAPFDCRMMAHVMPSISDKCWGCSMDGLRWAWNELAGGVKGLDAICRALEIPKAERHDAMADVRALQQVLATKTGVTAKSQTLLSRLIKKAKKGE